jgi:hypothetical protein
MSTLTIRKKSLKTWLHTDSILGNFIISKFYFNADNTSFQIVEQGQSKRVIYNINDITLYNEVDGGGAETFTTITELSLRLEELNYTAFQIDGQITSIANLIESGTNVTIVGDGTLASPYIISSTGGGGGGSQTLAQTLVLGNATDGEDILLSDGDAVLLDNGSKLKKGTTNAGNGGNNGVALKCSLDYELKWEAGRLYVMEQDGFTIRETSHNFNIGPEYYDDITKGFVVGSRWILDDGTLYTCSDNTTGAAVWDITVSGTPTLQEVLDNNHDLVNGQNYQGTNAGLGNIGTNVNFLGLDNGYSNEGNNVNALGYSAAFINIGNQVNAFGIAAAQENSADNVNALGTGAGQNNTFKNVNLFGYEAMPDAENQTVFSKWVSGLTKYLARISFNDITADRKYELPDASGTIALRTEIPTNTSELTNDGDDGNPFISLLDLPSNIIFYPTNVASDISGYVKIVTSITDPSYNTTAVDVSTGAITTTNQLISSLATSPNIIVGNPGVFNITTIGNIRRISGSGEASFYFQVYKRTSAGVETLIATSDNTIPVIDGGTYIEFSATAIWNDGIFLDTDRVVMKYYANRIAGGSNPTYQFQFGGITPVRTLVPIPLSVVPVIANATETVAGIAEIATTAEVTTGTDDTRIVTPLKLKQVTDNYMQVILNCNVLGSTVSGGTNVVLYQVNVPANTFSDLDAFEVEALGAKVGTTAASTIRLWTDTASTFNSGTAQLLAVSASLGATNLFQTIKREFHVRGTTVKVLANTVGVATDEATAALAANSWASYTFDPTIANTLYLTATGNAADTFTKQNYKITRYKNKSTI